MSDVTPVWDPHSYTHTPPPHLLRRYSHDLTFLTVGQDLGHVPVTRGNELQIVGGGVGLEGRNAAWVSRAPHWGVAPIRG